MPYAFLVLAILAEVAATSQTSPPPPSPRRSPTWPASPSQAAWPGQYPCSSAACCGSATPPTYPASSHGRKLWPRERYPRCREPPGNSRTRSPPVPSRGVTPDSARSAVQRDRLARDDIHR
jgi:hypothetical protein